MKNCPDRYKIDSFIYTAADVKKIPAPILVEAPMESWDDVCIKNQVFIQKTY